MRRAKNGYINKLAAFILALCMILLMSMSVFALEEKYKNPYENAEYLFSLIEEDGSLADTENKE